MNIFASGGLRCPGFRFGLNYALLTRIRLIKKSKPENSQHEPYYEDSCLHPYKIMCFSKGKSHDMSHEVLTYALTQRT